MMRGSRAANFLMDVYRRRPVPCVHIGVLCMRVVMPLRFQVPKPTLVLHLTQYCRPSLYAIVEAYRQLTSITRDHQNRPEAERRIKRGEDCSQRQNCIISSFSLLPAAFVLLFVTIVCGKLPILHMLLSNCPAFAPCRFNVHHCSPEDRQETSLKWPTQGHGTQTEVAFRCLL